MTFVGVLSFGEGNGMFYALDMGMDNYPFSHLSYVSCSEIISSPNSKDQLMVVFILSFNQFPSINLQ